jgi:5-methyltetrahydropteroyltriglutamate--homocysteine methyltransferase
MKRSVEQILTTHTGSLPRPAALTEALQHRDRGEGNGAGFQKQVREAVVEIVGQQAQAGVSVVNDGEASKIGYATYVKERLEGFGGHGGLAGMPADLQEFPEYMARVMGGLDFEMPACVGPVSYRTLDAARADIENHLAVDPGITWAKLRAMHDGANLASAQLW